MWRNRLFLVAIILSTYIINQVKPSYVTGFLYNMTWAVPILSLLSIIISYRVFRFNLKCSSPLIQKQQKVDYTIELYNPSYLMLCPMTFKIKTDLLSTYINLSEFKVVLGPHARLTIPLECIYYYSGVYHLGIESIRIRDFFSLLEWEFFFTGREVITVYPKHITLNKPITEEITFIQQKSVDQLDFSKESVFDIKSYQSGDSIKDIHWKLSAKTGSLKVRKHSKKTSPFAYVLMDRQWQTPEDVDHIAFRKALDKAYDINVTLLHKLVQSKVPTTCFFTNDTDKAYPVHHFFDLRHYFDSLNHGTVPMYEDLTPLLKKLYHLKITTETVPDNLFYITAYLSTEASEWLIKLSQENVNVQCYYVPFATDSASKEHIIHTFSKLRHLGIHVHSYPIETQNFEEHP